MIHTYNIYHFRLCSAASSSTQISLFFSLPPLILTNTNPPHSHTSFLCLRLVLFIRSVSIVSLYIYIYICFYFYFWGFRFSFNFQFMDCLDWFLWLSWNWVCFLLFDWCGFCLIFVVIEFLIFVDFVWLVNLGLLCIGVCDCGWWFDDFWYGFLLVIVKCVVLSEVMTFFEERLVF